jgi:hypothetical protein
MTIQRMEHVGILVDDLAAATFFVELGLKLQGEGRSRAVGWTAWWACVRPRADRDDGTPDGHGRLELTKFHTRRSGAATGTRRRIPRASAMSH